MKLVDQFIQNLLAKNLPHPPTPYYHLLQQFLPHVLETETDNLSIQTLPLLVCQASGGDIQRVIPIAVAWQALYQAVKLFDDVEDRELQHQTGEAINLGMGLLFVAQLAIDQNQTLDTDLEVAAVRQAFNRAILRACAGQHDDLIASRASATQVDPQTWLEIAGAKSGELLSWAAYAGAWAAGVDSAKLSHYRQYGYHLGVLLQIADDFNDIWQTEEPEDLLSGSLNLSVCYALSIAESKERGKLISYLKQAAQGDRQVAAKLRQRLTVLGAQAYLLVVGRTQRQLAIDALQKIENQIPAYQSLITLLDQMLPSVNRSLLN